MTGEFVGRRVVVTGASRGIGASIAERFAAEGASVVITARTLQEHDHLEGSLADTMARCAKYGTVVPLVADLADATVAQMCAGLDARKHNIPWEGEGPLPVERMAREAVDTPQDVPLHPAAEKYWRSKGYL